MQRNPSIARITRSLFAALTITMITSPAFAATALEAIEQAAAAPEQTATAETQLAATPAEPAASEPITLRAEDGRGVMTWLALILLGGAAFGTLVLLRRRDDTASETRPTIEVLQSARIGGKWQVSLVRVPGKTLVLGVTDKGLSTLAEIEEPHMVATPSATIAEVVTSAPEELASAPAQSNEESAEVVEEILNLTRRNKSAVDARIPNTDQDRRAILERLESYRRENIGA